MIFYCISRRISFRGSSENNPHHFGVKAQDFCTTHISRNRPSCIKDPNIQPTVQQKHHHHNNNNTASQESQDRKWNDASRYPEYKLRWCMITKVAKKNKQAEYVVYYLEDHPSRIQEKIRYSSWISKIRLISIIYLCWRRHGTSTETSSIWSRDRISQLMSLLLSSTRNAREPMNRVQVFWYQS